MIAIKNPNSIHDPKSKRQLKRVKRGINPHSYKPRIQKRINTYLGAGDGLMEPTTSHDGQHIRGRGKQKMW
jgi:hypothetical protein